MDIFPSGRTGTESDNSGLRHTLTCKESPTPIRYSGSTVADSFTTGAGRGLLLLHAASKNAAANKDDKTLINFFTRNSLMGTKASPAGATLMNAFTEQNYFDRLDHDEHVHQETMIFGVIQIVLKLVFCILNGRPIGVLQLRPAH